MFGAKSYKYPSLVSKPRVFRLIKLLPPEKSFVPFFSETLRIEIIEADLDSASPPEYDALSYTWGVPTGAQPNRRVIVETAEERQVMWIHKPLEEALRSIFINRATVRPLFVDQICIDQSETSREKEVLVPLMGEIYTRCRRVVVWLGTSTNRSDQFFDCVRELNEQGVMSRLIGPNKAHYMEIYDAVMQPDPEMELTGVKREDRDDLVALIDMFKDRFSRESMIDVLQRPWFNRLWIIQEVCLAPDVTFLCGSKTLCFECFRCACAFFPLYNGNWMHTVARVVSQATVNRANLLFELLQTFNRMFRERKAIHQLGQRQSYYDIMLKYNVNDQGKKINCTMAEDRLFAVMGLAGGDEDYSRIPVRYDTDKDDTRNSEGVYIDFASIAVRQNMDLLSFSQFPKSRPKLPSWVPDWSINLKLSHGYLSLTQPVHAAGGVKSEIPPEVDKVTRQLSVSGMVIGKISQVGKCVIIQDMVKRSLEQVEYASLRQFYEEADEILSRASNIPGCLFPWDSDAQLRRRAAIRLSDFGLTTKYMADRYGYTTETAYGKLETYYEQASIWGKKLIDTEANVRSYSLSRIIETVGIAPYYWVPASETDVIHLCATDPLAAAKTWLGGLLDFTVDMVSVCVASARVTWTEKWLRYKRGIGGFRFQNQHSSSSNHDEVLRKMGLNPEIAFGREMADYMDFVYRNIGHRLYMTEGGYVGVGPGNMDLGDSVVILDGATVPHVLRPHDPLDKEASDTLWAYLGEAYCDGVMEGQFLQPERESIVFRIN
ncbi:heterokaryon incompatibility protein [Xylariales sp. AK1849]|nr:heterokaryon incompatibility protein [Xylariales sp. AK1849]